MLNLGFFIALQIQSRRWRKTKVPFVLPAELGRAIIADYDWIGHNPNEILSILTRDRVIVCSALKVHDLDLTRRGFDDIIYLLND